MSIKLLTEHHLELLWLKGGCTGSSESTLVKVPHCWKSHVMAHLTITYILNSFYHKNVSGFLEIKVKYIRVSSVLSGIELT